MKTVQFSLTLFMVLFSAFLVIHVVEAYFEGKLVSANVMPAPEALLAEKKPEPAGSSPVRGALSMHQGLAVAAMTGDLQKVKSFLDKGVSPDARDTFGIRAIARAALWGHKEVVRLFLDYGAGVNEPERLGVTLLMLAANKGDKELVQLLLNRGADPARRSEDGETAYRVAQKKGFRGVMKILEPPPGRPAAKSATAAAAQSSLRGRPVWDTTGSEASRRTGAVGGEPSREIPAGTEELPDDTVAKIEREMIRDILTAKERSPRH